MAESKAKAEPITLDVAVVMVPLPAQGHLNQFLHLSSLLSARGLPIHYVGSATHNRQVLDRASRLHNGGTACRPIHFHDFTLPDYSSPAPEPDAAIKFPGHLQPAFDAARHLLSPLADLVRSLASRSRRVVLIHDSSMTFAAGAAASLPNVEAFCFHTVSAIAGFFFRWELRGKPREPAVEILELPHVSNEDCISQQFCDFVLSQQQTTVADSGRLINSCRAIEGMFIDLVAREPEWQDKKTFAIGPLNPITFNQASGNGARHPSIEWLDQQPPSSVIYVSFGTTSTFSDEQVAELAAGLEASGQRFLWVLRDADRADIYAETGGDAVEKEKLPLDYYTRVERRGKVVRGWAPQPEILAHPSTGGFMSHCGWNSCMESFSAGVPIVAWPMHSDQPRNAVLVTDVLRVGFHVLDWDKRAELVASATISDVIERLMASKEGEEVRRRARELGGEVRRAMEEGGSSKTDLDAFVTHIII
ncbi:unnamed protein product [Musa acuminata subsp. malaccensis]|uniref:Glycosyltransferase n=1 Tax=Musa acuminata subsp. malaccensis TaxID=214687 RepID=A0A804J3W7_MUSAM|nr:PREDICTED: zeatin O-xylosyltransferase-like [Musa acuminata subsp. malaccensis]CAG1838340.1 unnamed protein product [Musa acuminata subsp. malaccensis]